MVKNIARLRGFIIGEIYLAGMSTKNVASRRGGVHRIHNGFNMNAQHLPLLVAKDHNRDPATLQVLLMNEVLVRCNQYFKTSWPQPH